MFYQTRNLVAREEFRHEGRELVAGDAFEATEIDAKYYVGAKMASEAPPAPPAATGPEPKPVGRRGARASAEPAPPAPPDKLPNPIAEAGADGQAANGEAAA